MNDNQSQVYRRDDDLELIELIQELWAHKKVILLAVAISLVVAMAYCMIAKPKFLTQVVISPGSIKYYGSIAAEFSRGDPPTSQSPIAIGTALSNDAFRLYLNKLKSPQVRSAFHHEFKHLSAPAKLQVQREKNTLSLDELTTISAESTDPKATKEYLDAFIKYSADLSVAQLNEYFQAVGVKQSLTSEALFNVEVPVAIPESPIRPKRALVLVLGIVLGLMLGVFVALINIFIQKNKVSRESKGSVA